MDGNCGEREEREKRGSATATTVTRARGARRTATGQRGDEATKSIILLNNKLCYVRFAKITKTTTRSRFCVYAGSFIRALTTPTAISIHPSAARNYHRNG